MPAPRRFGRAAAIAIVATVAIAYWPLLQLPLVQDDWIWMARFEFEPWTETLRSMFAVENQIFFRPGAKLVLLVEHALFGSCALGYGVVACALQALAALAAVRCVRPLVASRKLAWLTGLLYAGATSVLLEPMTWAVGIYELGAALLTFVSIGAFLHGRTRTATAAFAAALTFKETAAAIVPILLAIAWLQREHAGRWRRCLPALGVLALWLVLKAFARSPFALPADDPYAAALAGRHVLDNLRNYTLWTAQAVLPVQFSMPVKIALAASIATLLVPACRPLARRWRRSWRQLVVLAAWATLTLAPALVLRNHPYRYYLMLGLPATIALIVWHARVSLAAMRPTRHRAYAALTVAATASLVLSAVHVRRVVHEGLAPRHLTAGTSTLVRRALVVRRVRDTLLRTAANAPADAVLCFRGVDLFAFEHANGPRVWLHNRHLEVLGIDRLQRDGTDLVANAGDREVRLPGERVLAYEWRDGELEPVEAR